MPARLLAYGGTSFSERRRIGSWPAIPEATLRDNYALSPTAWSYGFGVLEAQPFLIFRQKQNMEQRGGYPFSLLLDPGEPVWSRFEWNAASIADAVLAANPDALFRTPDACSGDALETMMMGLRFAPPRIQMGALSQLIAAGAAVAEPIVAGFVERPSPSALAGALASLPLCFRAGGGWLAGGGIAHGRAFGAGVVFDEQAPGNSGAVEYGRKLLEAWDAARQKGAVKHLDGEPIWNWDENPAAVIEAVLLLHEIETTDAASDELVERAAQASALKNAVDDAITSLLTRGTKPLGARQTAKLVRDALQGRKIDPKVAGRLHRETLLKELAAFGSPPKPLPVTLPVSREMRVGLWYDYLQSLKSNVPISLAQAFDQLGPQFDREEHAHLVQGALDRLQYSNDRLLDWAYFKKYPDTWPLIEAPLREESLQQFMNRQRGAAEAYLLLGNDPGGLLAREIVTQQPYRTKLVEAIRSLRELHPELAQEWLDAMPTSRAKTMVVKTTGVKEAPITRPAPVLPKSAVESELVGMLRELLFASDSAEVDDKANAFEKAVGSPDPEERTKFDAMVEENCASNGKNFAAAFLGKYGPLGAVMAALSDLSRARLIECLSTARDFLGIADRDLRHAFGTPGSRNAYTQALSQYLLDNPKLLAKVGDLAPGGLVNLQRRLKEMVKP